MERENLEQRDVHRTTPAGETGVDDIRETSGEHGKGRVADAAGVRSIDGERHTMPSDSLSDLPSADDPFGSTPSSDTVAKMARSTEGPTYERGQGTEDQSTGGSTDPHNSMTHANSGDETEATQGENE